MRACLDKRHALITPATNKYRYTGAVIPYYIIYGNPTTKVTDREIQDKSDQVGI